MASRAPARRGAAAVEFAIALPLLLALLVISIDFARAYSVAQVVTDCARNGAIYASHPDLRDRSPFETTEDAAVAGATKLSPEPTVTVDEGVDSTGRGYAEVTVSYPFELVSGLGGGYTSITISRTVRARLYPEGEDE
jgi:Flp pilus assembly protein TadG